MSFSVILNEFERAFVRKLMSGNTQELDTGVHWQKISRKDRPFLCSLM